MEERQLTNVELLSENHLDHRLEDKDFKKWLEDYKDKIGEVWEKGKRVFALHF